MKKILTKVMALLLALTMLMGLSAVSIAEEAASEPVTAWLLYFANPGWWPQHQRMDQPASETGVDATNAVITGPGTYTVGLKFNWQTAENAMQFNLVLDNAEKMMPGLYVDITDIRVNGASITMTADNLYGTFHDDTESGFAPIYNTYWDVNHADGAGSTGPDPATMRAFDGTVDTESHQIIDPAQIVAGSTIEVDFVVAKEAGAMPEEIGEAPAVYNELVAPAVLPEVETSAWIQFADGAWWPQRTAPDQTGNGVKYTDATVTGEGYYTVGLDFASSNWHANGANGISTAALIIKDGETLLPNMYVQITDIRIDGTSVDFNNNLTAPRSWDNGDDAEGDDTGVPLYVSWMNDTDHNTFNRRDWTDGATCDVLDPSLIEKTGSIEIDFFVATAPGVEPPPPGEVEYTWFGNTVGLAGLSLSDLGMEDDWHNIVPVDLTKTAYYTYTLVGADAHIIGTAIVAVNNGNVSVQCIYARGEIYEKGQCIKWFTSLDDITAAELASREGGLTCNDIVNVDADLGGADIAYLSINNKVTWRSPVTNKGETLPRYWRNMDSWKDYRASLMEMIETPAAEEAPAE